MFKKKPLLTTYNINYESIKSFDFYLNGFFSNDGKIYSFRCPNKKCGRFVKVGYPMCPFN